MISPPEIQMAATAALRKMGVDIDTKTLTYDGNGGGVDIFGDGNLYTNIYANYVDHRTFASAVVIAQNREFTIGPEQVTIEQEDTTAPWAMSTSDGVMIAVCVPDEAEDAPSGLHVLANPDTYVKSMTFETIHPIDPKFLPGVCFPKTIDLSAYEFQTQDGANKSFNDAILKGINLGSDMAGGEYDGTFWDDVDTDQQIRFKLSMGMIVTVDGGAVIRENDGSVSQVTLSAFVLLDNGPKNVSVIIYRDAYNTIIVTQVS